MATALCVLSGNAAAAADSAATAGGAGAQSSDYKVGDKLRPAAKPSAAESGFRLTKWEELVPKDWNPLKDLKDLNLSILSDADPRAQEALDRLKRAWDTAPTEPSMDNQRIRIAGFIVPLEFNSTQMREFLLVPYFGACIHVPPPPANQIIHVTSAKPLKDMRAMDAAWVSGRLHTRISDTSMGTSGYRMDAEDIAPYKEQR
jgi:hypothetical protein